MSLLLQLIGIGVSVAGLSLYAYERWKGRGITKPAENLICEHGVHRKKCEKCQNTE